VEEIEEFEDEESEDEKKSPLKWIIMVVALVALAGGGYWGYQTFFVQTSTASPSQQVSSGSTRASLNSGFGQIYSLDTFVVNLSEKGGKRYLKTKIEVEYTHEATHNELVSRTPQIRDSILIILSSKTMQEIQNVEGKLSLKNELLVKINQMLRAGKIRGLFFTEFVIQ
jgi:flagellar FliL protein